MKTLLPFLFVLVVFASCTVNKVDQYPGKPLAAFPDEVQGEYRAKATGLKSIFYGKQLDSLRIRISPKGIAMLGQKGWENIFTISNKEILTELNGYYFLSNKDNKESDFWNTHAMFMEGKELVFFNIAATGNDLTKDKLKNYLQLMLMTRKGGKEVKDPVTADSTLAGVSDINEASTDSVLYYHMNEEKLISYIATEKSAKNTLRFVRVKTAPVKPKK
jgi:hypothetical protein